jgi:cell volume regulation protein A
MDVNNVLLGISLIIMFGFFAEFIFKKFGIPDLLLLVFLGFIIGPNVLHWANPADFTILAPLFTSFALLFLLFEGSLSIDLRSFAKGLVSGSSVAFFNFIVSSAVILGILLLLGFDFLLALLIGFALGGISSAFVMPLLKQLKPKGETYTILALESALTDVFTIVFALTVMQLIKLNIFNFKTVLVQIVSLFAVAGLIGIVGAVLWIFLDKRVFKEHRSFMSTIAFLIIVYFITEFLGGNGAIASLFFGIVLTNSKQITSIIKGIASKNEKDQEVAIKGELGLAALSNEEHLFYSQISFFLKTFFFVYIGLLLNLKNMKAFFIGALLALAIMFARNLSLVITKKMASDDKTLINAVFARGLAAAAVIQIVVENNIIHDSGIVDMVYFFIVATILLSSIRVFIYRIKNPAVEAKIEAQAKVEAKVEEKIEAEEAKIVAKAKVEEEKLEAKLEAKIEAQAKVEAKLENNAKLDKIDVATAAKSVDGNDELEIKKNLKKTLHKSKNK